MKKPYHFVEVSIFAYQLLGLLLKTDSYRAGLLVHMLYPHEMSKYLIIPSVGMWLRPWLPVQFQNTKPFLVTAGVKSKFSAACSSSRQIFTDLILGSYR